MKTISFRIHSNFADKWIAVWGKLNPFTNSFRHKSSRLKVIVHKQRNWNCTGTKLTIRTTLLLFRWQPWIPPSHSLLFAQRTHNRISVACNSLLSKLFEMKLIALFVFRVRFREWSVSPNEMGICLLFTGIYCLYWCTQTTSSIWSTPLSYWVHGFYCGVFTFNYPQRHNTTREPWVLSNIDHRM